MSFDQHDPRFIEDPERVFGPMRDEHPLVQRDLDGSELLARHAREGACPEHLPDHGGILEQALALGGEGVEARGDQAVRVVQNIPGVSTIGRITGLSADTNPAPEAKTSKRRPGPRRKD